MKEIDCMLRKTDEELTIQFTVTLENSTKAFPKIVFKRKGDNVSRIENEFYSFISAIYEE